MVTIPANVETMFSNRQVPWHGLGTIVQEAPTSQDAIHLAGLDWIVKSRQVWVEVTAEEMAAYQKPTEHIIQNMGEGLAPKILRLQDEHIANVRDSDGSALGIVSDRYKIIQNYEAFQFTDSLIQDGVMKYETAGALNRGRTIWLLGRLEDQVRILGDDVKTYVLFINAHDGSAAVRILTTPVRVVCQNTLNMALNNYDRSWSAVHTGDMTSKLNEARRTLGMVRKYVKGVGDMVDRLANIFINPEAMDEMINNVLPIEENPSIARERNIEAARDDVFNRTLASDLVPFNDTGWAFVNAVADHLAHYKDRITDSRFTRIAAGHPMLDRATNLVLEHENV